MEEEGRGPDGSGYCAASQLDGANEMLIISTEGKLRAEKWLRKEERIALGAQESGYYLLGTSCVFVLQRGSLPT